MRMGDWSSDVCSSDLVYCPWQNNRRCGKSLLGCRRCRPGRQDVFRSLSPENESGLTPFPHRRSLPSNGSVRLQQVKIHSAIHYNLCYNRAHNISVPSCHFPERCKQEEINMDIKEEIHALSEEMLTNLGRLVAIDSQDRKSTRLNSSHPSSSRMPSSA